MARRDQLQLPGCALWPATAHVLCALIGASPADASNDNGGRGTVVIGSKGFAENRLLGEIMAQLIEASTELHVERRVNLGGSTVAFAALQKGDIDLYPEYTGTAWNNQLKLQQRVTNPLQAYLRVAATFRRRFGLVWLWPFGFSNSYALAMDERRASELGVRTISDLERLEEPLRVGFSHEFLNRPDGYPGLASVYGLRFPGLRGLEHGLAYQAIASGQVDLVDSYTTDGRLLRYRLRLLQDDRDFFPPYDCAPVIRADTLERHPELRALLQRLAFRLDDKRMRQLNYRVELGGESFAEVARRFLRGERLTDGDSGQMGPATRSEAGFLAFFWSRRAETVKLIGEHLWLTAVAVILAILVAVPLGIMLTRKKRLAPPVLGAAGVIQTVPSLALLAFMIPLPGLGLGARSAVAALFLYALLPIVRNTFTGITEIGDDLVEAAHAMGMTRRQVLLRIELPLATRTIMAGIRTSAVISVGVATLAAFIGAGGLGDPIVTGLQLNDINLILSGAAPAALLALLVDFVLGRAEHGLVRER